MTVIMSYTCRFYLLFSCFETASSPCEIACTAETGRWKRSFSRAERERLELSLEKPPHVLL